MDRPDLRRIILYLIPAVTIVAFALYLGSGEYLKKPTGNEDDFPHYLRLLKEDVNNEDWEAASSDLDKLEAAWNKVLQKIQYTAERTQIQEITSGIARVKGAIGARDKAIALVEISELESHWNALGTPASTI